MEGRLSGGDQSLNAFVSEDGESEWLNFIADERPDPEEIVIGTKDAQARSKWLRLALSKLTDRERKIIKDRHLGYETVTLEALGGQLGVSKERVRQLEQRAMQKLHTTLNKEIRNVNDLLLEA